MCRLTSLAELFMNAVADTPGCDGAQASAHEAPWMLQVHQAVTEHRPVRTLDLRRLGAAEVALRDLDCCHAL